jgi:transcriptional regulator with XRE-family HTH domain
MSTLRYYEALRAEIVSLLKQERGRRKRANYAISQRSGVSESTLGRIERGQCNPSLETALRIADGIGADLPAIIKKARAGVSKGASPRQ